MGTGFFGLHTMEYVPIKIALLVAGSVYWYFWGKKISASGLDEIIQEDIRSCHQEHRLYHHIVRRGKEYFNPADSQPMNVGAWILSLGWTIILCGVMWFLIYFFGIIWKIPLSMMGIPVYTERVSTAFTPGLVNRVLNVGLIYGGFYFLGSMVMNLFSKTTPVSLYNRSTYPDYEEKIRANPWMEATDPYTQGYHTRLAGFYGIVGIALGTITAMAWIAMPVIMFIRMITR